MKAGLLTLRVSLLILILGTVTALPAQETAPQPSPVQPPTNVSPAIKQIVGDYLIQAGKANGKEVIKDRLTDVTVRITEHTITTYDRERRERYSASYRLETDGRPWKILMTPIPKQPRDPSLTGEAVPSQPASSQGLLEVDEDGKRLKLIYALPGGQPPQDFQAQEGQNFFELVRIDKSNAPLPR